MRKLVDNLLNGITMYRVVLYALSALLLIAMGLGYAGVLAYGPLMILFSVAFITLVCWAANTLFAAIFNAPKNTESVYISALILAFIITPPQNMGDGLYLEIAFWASVWSMAGKYIFAIGKKHVFNPVALGVAITALALNNGATWWVGTGPMLPFVIIAGVLITRKILRADLVVSFLIAAALSIAATHVSSGFLGIPALWRALLESPLIFFATVMLTEPLTTPPTRWLRIVYGILVGVLFAPSMHVGNIYSTPELALIVSNVFSYIVSPKKKLMLQLRERVLAARDTYDFWFDAEKTLHFKAGQYLEWTLPHDRPDSRGNRRTFTIASSPTESGLMIGVKFYEHGSSFKEKLFNLNRRDIVVGAQLAGDFTLPHDKKKKLAFIAGGIGVTPFRSMIKYLVDKKEKRDIVMLYSNRTPRDVAYAGTLEEARSTLGINTVYTITDPTSAGNDWQGRIGYINEDMIRREVPDFRERHFYLSGPQSMVHAAQDALHRLGVHESQVTKDFFPGFA
jgi:ferredoxin-NADP reductase